VNYQHYKLDRRPLLMSLQYCCGNILSLTWATVADGHRVLMVQGNSHRSLDWSEITTFNFLTCSGAPIEGDLVELSQRCSSSV